MKKFLTVFLAVCFSFCFLTGCQNQNSDDTDTTRITVPQNAKELWDRINAAMDALDSYEAVGTGTMSLNVMGVQLFSDVMTKSIVAGVNGEDYYDYSFSDVSVKMTVPGEDSSQAEVMSEKSMEAFYNGKMFVSSESAENTKKFCSPMTKDAYIAYRNSKGEDIDNIDFHDCVTASFAQNEDLSWTLSYSGYTKKTIDKLLESFGMSGNEFIDFDISDVEVTILADQDYRVQEMKIQFIFDEDGVEEISATSFEIVMKYSSFNAAVPITDTLNPADYQEIPDCRVIFDFEDILKKREEQEQGSFVLSVTQAVDFPALQKTEIYREIDTVAYGKKEGGYFYDIQAETSSGDMNISYENGKQTISGPDVLTQSVDQTEDEARDFIGSLIRAANLNMNDVSEISAFSDSVYVIQCDHADVSDMEILFASYGGELYSVRRILYITAEDGKITQIKSNTFADGLVIRDSQAVEMVVTVTSTCTFYQ